MAINTVNVGDKSIAASGFVQCLALWDSKPQDEVSIFWNRGVPNVNFHKMTAPIDGKAGHLVLKPDSFGGNSIKVYVMSDAKYNGKHIYGKEQVLHTGLHTGNIGLTAKGEILHIVDPDLEGKKGDKGESLRNMF